MISFRQAIDRHFRHRGERDSLPFGVRPRRKGQDGRLLLAQVMRDLGFRVGVEIGTQYGLSAKLWCETIPGLYLTCIDPYVIYQARRSQTKQDAVYEEAKKTLSPFGAILLREKSLDAVTQFQDRSLDFLHVDGNHEFDECVQDIIHYVPKVRVGGLVIIHDYVSFYRGGVVEAVNGYTRCHGINPWYVTSDIAPSAFWQRGAERL